MANQQDLIRCFFRDVKRIAVSAVDVALWGQTKPLSNLTQETLKRLVGSSGRATSDVTESIGTVLVNSEEYSAKTSRGIIQRGTSVRVGETDGLTLLVEKA